MYKLKWVFRVNKGETQMTAHPVNLNSTNNGNGRKLLFYSLVFRHRLFLGIHGSPSGWCCLVAKTEEGSLLRYHTAEIEGREVCHLMYLWLANKGTTTIPVVSSERGRPRLTKWMTVNRQRQCRRLAGFHREWILLKNTTKVRWYYCDVATVVRYLNEAIAPCYIPFTLLEETREPAVGFLGMTTVLQMALSCTMTNGALDGATE